MGQGGEVRGHKAGVTDDGHSLNCVRRKCRLIARRDRYHRLEFASAFAAVRTATRSSLALLTRTRGLYTPLFDRELGCAFSCDQVGAKHGTGRTEVAEYRCR